MTKRKAPFPKGDKGLVRRNAHHVSPTLYMWCGCEGSLKSVPSPLHKMLMLRSYGVGIVTIPSHGWLMTLPTLPHLIFGRWLHYSELVIISGRDSPRDSPSSDTASKHQVLVKLFSRLKSFCVWQTIWRFPEIGAPLNHPF